MRTVKQTIDRVSLAMIEEDYFGVFDAESLSCMLRTELEAVWHKIPGSTRAILIGASAELMRHHANGLIADIAAAQLISRVKKKN
jgi:hypothetical protein